MVREALSVAIDARLIGTESTGDASYWKGLVRGIFRSDPPLRVTFFSNRGQPAQVPLRACDRWEVVKGAGRLWSLVKFPLAAYKSGCAVVHSQYSLSPLVRKGGVTTVHDVSFMVGPQWFKPKDRFLLRAGVSGSIRRAARVLTVSETSRKEIVGYFPIAAEKTVVTPNALGENIVPMQDNEAEARVKHLGVQGPFALTVGTRWPRKNQSLAVEACQLAQFPVVVTGHAGWGDELSYGQRTGYVSDADLTALYRQASLYLAPSFHEGFGIPLLEAFACGCPVMCSTGGALPETAGGAAEVVESWDPRDWAEKIAQLLADSGKLSAMRERGLHRVKEFDWATTARLTAVAYQEAAEL